jgi:hypothetical protein
MSVVILTIEMFGLEERAITDEQTARLQQPMNFADDKWGAIDVFKDGGADHNFGACRS